MTDSTFSFTPIGVVHSPFREKFGIPRQPGLVPQIKGRIELLPPFNRSDCVRGLETFSHVWVLFLFHNTAADGWRPTVRPPRLGGKKKVGVFASRSNFRPNPIGQSVVRLDRIDTSDGKVVLDISGHDLLDQTPVLDIKPYLGYADCISNSRDGYAQAAPSSLEVRFSPEAKAECDALRASGHGDVAALLRALLVQDPRPAFHKRGNKDKRYGMNLGNLEVFFEVTGCQVCVTGVTTGNSGDKR
jgi:tRNA-Thr(GGU) m(6)t(6)A37 methyltransferase TsaA